MSNYFRQHPGSIALSVLLHGALAAALIVSVDFAVRAPHPATELAIQATVVDQKAVQQEMQQLDKQQAEERKKQQAAEQRKKEQEEKQHAAQEAAARKAQEEQRHKQEQLEQLRAKREEAARVAEQKREREAAEEKKRAAAAAAAAAEKKREAEEAARKAEEQRKQEAEQRRLAEEKRKREEEAKREAEAAARRQKELNEQLNADIATEERRRKAEQSGLLDQYVRLIQNQIEQRWIKPPSAHPGLKCVVDVQQIPDGTVVAVHVRADQCNGDAAVRRSIETAVLKASPLPKPPVPELFERNLVITFHPDQVG